MRLKARQYERLSPQKLHNMQLGSGPHWLCYRCDAFVSTDEAPCPTCRRADLIGRCIPSVCGHCHDALEHATR